MFHFTNTENNLNRINSIVGNSFSSLNVGSLSLDNIKDFSLYSKKRIFKNVWGVDLDQPTILITVHPETINFFDKNEQYAVRIRTGIKHFKFDYQLLIASSNDTKASVYSQMF